VQPLFQDRSADMQHLKNNHLLSPQSLSFLSPIFPIWRANASSFTTDFSNQGQRDKNAKPNPNTAGTGLEGLKLKRLIYICTYNTSFLRLQKRDSTIIIATCKQNLLTAVKAHSTYMHRWSNDRGKHVC